MKKHIITIDELLESGSTVEQTLASSSVKHLKVITNIKLLTVRFEVLCKADGKSNFNNLEEAIEAYNEI